MKKLMTLLVFSVLLVACVKPEPPAPPLVTFPLTVFDTGKGETSPKAAVVPLGESRTLVSTADPGWVVYSVKVNSTVYEVPFGSTSYLFTITNINTKQDVFVVFVKEENLWISKDRWYIWSEENQYTENGPWYLQNIPAQMYSDYMVFALDGKFTMYHSNGVIFGGPYSWTLVNGTITTSGTIYTVKLLDANKMVLEFIVYNTEGGHCLVRQTYYHTPKPLS